MLLVFIECKNISPADDPDARIYPWTFYIPLFFIHANEFTEPTCDLIVEYAFLGFFISHILTRQSDDPVAI